jgi:precorrin-6B methylase 2
MLAASRLRASGDVSQLTARPILVAVRSLLRTIADAGRHAIVERYFAASYRVLAAPAGREFLRAAAAPDAPAVHGYSTSEDIAALLEALRPSRDDVLVDLGCGIGEVAIAVHRRAGCRVVGIDASVRAIEEARRRADEEGVAAAVTLEVGDVGSTVVRGSTAYALDSLMFVRRPPDLLAVLSESLEPPGRVFATFIDHRGLDRDAFARYIGSAGLRVERIDDVTGRFRQRSRTRAAAARRVFRARPPRVGRLGLLLVLVEEAMVTWLVERGRLRRWRFSAVSAESVAGGGSQSSGPK